jgi:hypothetical protein
MRFRIPFLFACFALGAFLMAATSAYAGAACGGPCQQLPPVDPGGGGGEPYCASVQCWYCGGAPDPGGFQRCQSTNQNAACTCIYSQGVCGGYGQCDYTG